MAEEKDKDKYTFELIMSGLCAFVPNTRGGRVRVLLVDARTGMTNHGGEPKGPLPSGPMKHVPRFIFKSANLEGDPVGRWPSGYEPPKLARGGDGAEPDVPALPAEPATPPSAPPPPNYCYDLDREDLVIRGLGGKELNIPFAISEKGDTDFSQVAQMGRVDNDAGEVIREALGAEPPYSVVARLTITDGTLGTSKDWILKAKPGDPKPGDPTTAPKPITWTFRPKACVGRHNRYTQFLAGAAILRIPLEMKQRVCIWSTGMGRHQNSPWTIALKPTGEGDTVTAFLGNIPEHSKYLHGCLMPEPDPIEHPQADEHFEWFYDLCARDFRPPRLRSIPHPEPSRNGGPGKEVGTDECPPLVFDPHFDA